VEKLRSLNWTITHFERSDEFLMGFNPQSRGHEVQTLLVLLEQRWPDITSIEPPGTYQGLAEPALADGLRPAKIGSVSAAAEHRV